MPRSTSLGYYREHYITMRVLAEKRGSVTRKANRLAQGRRRYEAVQRATGVPWPIIGLIHDMEASFSWDKQILNGERFTRRTRLVPSGHGPWTSWHASSVYAMRLKNWHEITDWGIGRIGELLERYNGLGYANRNKNSPYLWSFSNHGVGVGKYTSDGVYDPHAVSRQAGAMLTLRRLGEMGLWAPRPAASAGAHAPLVAFDASGDFISLTVQEYQAGLNSVSDAVARRTGSRPFNALAVDGWAGRSTSAAAKTVSGRYLIGDSRG